jgi:hypothetical protein
MQHYRIVGQKYTPTQCFSSVILIIKIFHGLQKKKEKKKHNSLAVQKYTTRGE